MHPITHRRATRWLTLCLSAAALLIISGAAPSDAGAFCGFYVSGADGELFNDATQVTLMRQGQTTVLSMQNHYDGPPEDFAMVVPVPQILQEENVKTLPHAVFTRVDQMGAPRLVEYWEQDPCAPFVEHDRPTRTRDSNRRTRSSRGSGGGGSVRIEAQFEVGEYEVVILSADDSMALDTWLREQSYNIPAGAEAVLNAYVESGQYFFVAKVNLDKVERDEQGRAILSPLRFHYETDTFMLPVRLGLLNARGEQDMIISVLAQNQRYEVANKPNVTIPTNIDLQDEAKEQFGPFYAALLDATLAKHPGAVVTEYAWDASTCDPCPGPTLTSADFLTLGADVLSGRPQRGFVLTRLHARYGPGDLSDDLVFQAAAPIVGGREVRTGENQSLEHGASAARMNNFQGRYAIRHPWQGEVACDNPVRGRWGGPPRGGGQVTRASLGPGRVSAATDTAFVDRDAVSLPRLIAQDIDELEIRVAQADGAPAGGDAPAPEAAGGTNGAAPVEAAGTNGAAAPVEAAGTNGAAAPVEAAGTNGAASGPPNPALEEKGGCAVGPLTGGRAGGGWALAALAALALVVRRRRG